MDLGGLAVMITFYRGPYCRPIVLDIDIPKCLANADDEGNR